MAVTVRLSVAPVRVFIMLSVKAMMTLDFEAEHAVTSAASNARKEVAVRKLFDESATLYYQRLNRLVDDADAEVYAPLLVRRLRRMRERRQSARSARRLVMP